MCVFSATDFDAHEDVLFCHDPSIGLFGIIAIHSTKLGPAAGGCRMYPYPSVDVALTDVLRLSKGMSYKNAMAGLPLGGGKCVIIADPSSPKRDELLRAFSKHVQSLGGKYWTAIDVGVGPKEADVLAENCEYVFARASQYPEGFSVSNFTALGGFMGIRAVSKHLWDKTDLTNLKVAVQGLGGTGRELSRLLFEAGASLVVADINAEAVTYAVENFQAEAVSPEDIHKQEVDIFAPCALGGVVNDKTLPEINAKAICGLANNQLKAPYHGQMLLESGIIYVPDYVVNAGGVMGAAPMIYSQPTMEESRDTVLGLYDIVLELLEKAKAANRPTSEVADEMADEIMSTEKRVLMNTL
ncbi:MAG: Glu/Leu/Phe/Val dehydrogenase dimerization domain-containing protein [Bacteroidota bacterium]